MLPAGDLLAASGGSQLKTVSAPRSDGSVLHVDFEHYVDRVIGILNAGVRALGYPFGERPNRQHKVAITTDAAVAFAGSRCGYAFSAKNNQTARIRLQARFNAPRLRGREIIEFVFRPVRDKPVDLEEFGVWSGGGGVHLLATGSAKSGTYGLAVAHAKGRTPTVVEDLPQSKWIRVIVDRRRSRKTAELWIVTADGEKRIGQYPDRGPKSSTTYADIGDTSKQKNRGSGYWDDIRIGRKLGRSGKLAPSEKVRNVGKELPKITYPIQVGRTKQLFVDDVVAGSYRNLDRTLHPVRKHPKNPLVIPDRPTDSKNALIYGGVIKDPTMGGKFRMWYLAYGRKVNPSYISYAESDDGINWKKPNLGLIEDFTGSKANNVVMPGWSDTTVLFDPEDPNPAYRYKCMNRLGGHTAWTSPDGLRWKKHRSMISQGYDCSTVAWDPVGRKWMASLKISREGKRSRGYAESKDYFHWSDSYLMLHTDEKDLPRDHIYAMIVSRYESLYIGLLRMYHVGTSYKVDIELATSRNGKHWDRLFRKPLIPTGDRLGGWAGGNQSPSTAPPIRVGDELWFYYSGRKDTHSKSGKNPKLKADEWRSGIGLATLRVDGFVSVDAGPQEGVLTTRPLVLKNDALYVNADADGGRLAVEILDAESNAPIGAFTGSACELLTADRVRQKVSWKGTAGLKSLKRRPVRLRFHLKFAKLYAFWTE